MYCLNCLCVSVLVLLFIELHLEYAYNKWLTLLLFRSMNYSNRQNDQWLDKYKYDLIYRCGWLFCIISNHNKKIRLIDNGVLKHRPKIYAQKKNTKKHMMNTAYSFYTENNVMEFISTMVSSFSFPPNACRAL